MWTARNISVAFIVGGTLLASSVVVQAAVITNHQDIGSPAIAGDYSFSTGPPEQHTVVGSGRDIWGNSDEFHFAYETFSGDGEIVAKVESITGGFEDWRKVGVMMRDSLAPNSKYAMMMVTSANRVCFQWRASTSSLSSGTYGVVAPYWVKLALIGDTFTGYHSPDGIDWTQQGSPQVISFSSPSYIGLAVTSHNNHDLTTGVFSNVTMSGVIPEPSTIIVWSVLATLAITFGWWRRRRAA